MILTIHNFYFLIYQIIFLRNQLFFLFSTLYFFRFNFTKYYHYILSESKHIFSNYEITQKYHQYKIKHYL